MLRSIIFAALFLLVSLPITAQSSKTTKDEQAIKEVIENESKYFWGRDFKSWKKLYVHKPYVSWTAASRDGVRTYQGWTAWSEQVQSLFEESPDPMPYDGVVKKMNYQIQIYGSGAWVSFTQVNDGTKTMETRIMEKEKGKWKIAMVQLIYNANEGDTAANNE